MDRQICKAIAAAAEMALADVAKGFGLHVKRGTANFDSTSAKIQMVFSEISEDGTVMTREAEAFKDNADMYGLRPEDLGEKFDHKGHTFTITGLNARARKMPIQVTREDGRTFKFAALTVKRILHGLGA